MSCDRKDIADRRLAFTALVMGCGLSAEAILVVDHPVAGATVGTCFAASCAVVVAYLRHR